MTENERYRQQMGMPMLQGSRGHEWVNCTITVIYHDKIRELIEAEKLERERINIFRRAVGLPMVP